MFWEKLFGKKKESFDFTRELTLSTLRPGYMVDYDLITWQVAAHHRYDWGGGYVTDEWELKSAREVRYLEREEDDEVEWLWSRKIPLTDFSLDIKRYFTQHEDPPEELVYQGVIYKLNSEAVGKFHKDRAGPAVEFICWDYMDPSGEKSLSIEQWGEREFETSEGHYVEEYQFSNILPAP